MLESPHRFIVVAVPNANTVVFAALCVAILVDFFRKRNVPNANYALAARSIEKTLVNSADFLVTLKACLTSSRNAK